tara:strand:+ start:240 stop:497 length:258 start_codon:yes stop_codon:yes gene_type:complete
VFGNSASASTTSSSTRSAKKKQAKENKVNIFVTRLDLEMSATAIVDLGKDYEIGISTHVSMTDGKGDVESELVETIELYKRGELS